ncbi:MAG: hypothetical protein ACRBN8_45560 [Nannocystales bacterium]
MPGWVVRGTLSAILLGGCGPAVSESAGGGADGGVPLAAAAQELIGRYGVAYQTESAIEQLGSIILDEGGEGDFIPGWICDESVRHPLTWRLEAVGSEVLVHISVVDGLEDDGFSVVIEGGVGNCLDSVLRVTVEQDTWNGLAFPVEGECLAGLVGVVCTNGPCEEDLLPACAAES